MHWPQITMIALMALCVGFDLEKHGKPREPSNAWHSIISVAIWSWLLIAGGFFG